MAVRVVLADSHTIVRQGIRALLEREHFSVAGEASNGKEAVELARNLRPDVAVLACSMPQLDGLNAARQILGSSLGTGIVLLAASDSDRLLLAALRTGVRGYVDKADRGAELIRAIREVARGETYLSPSALRLVVRSNRTRAYIPPTS